MYKLVEMKDSQNEKTYNPYRIYKFNSNGIFQDTSQLHSEIKASNLLNPQEESLDHSRILDLSKYIGEAHYFKWRAHETGVTTLRCVQVPNAYILTAAGNSLVVKMWSIDGTLMGAFNIDIPLPYKWKITIETKQKHQTKALKGLICANEIQTRFKATTFDLNLLEELYGDNTFKTQVNISNI